MSDRASLFTPIELGAVTARNRVLMAPLTRNRAHADGTPKALAVEYYRQRATAGLIITEATQISPQGKGYIDTPGIHADGHVTGWRQITDAVHEAGGKIALQLWHVGRISHVDLQVDGAAPVAPSAIRANAQTFIDGMVDVSEPRALATDEIAGVIADYEAAARRAKDAGFDMVELHGANGYLVDQFLQDRTNTRTDAYGGSVANRTRFLLEALEAVTGVWGADRVGVRLSPTGAFNDIGDSDPHALFTHVYGELAKRGLAYLHVVEKFPGATPSDGEIALLETLRKSWTGPYIANGDFNADSAAAWIASGRASAVAFGRPYIANPDLVARFAAGAGLNEPDHTTFYGGGAAGYTDYPALVAA